MILSTVLKLGLLAPVADMPAKADERQYVAAARSINETGVPVYPNQNWDEAHAAPGMPYFLAACYAIAGEDGFRTLARFIQVLLSATTVLFTFAITLRLGAGRRPALLASALVAFNPTQIAFTHYFWSESLYCSITTALVWAVLRSEDPQRSAGASFVAGLVGGVACLTRSFFVTQIPLVLGWMLIGRRGQIPLRRRALTASLFLVGAMVVVLPWSARNTVRYGRFLLISTNGGAVLAKGANPLRPENRDLGLEGWGAELMAYHRRYAPSYEGVIPLYQRARADNLVERYELDVRRSLGFMIEHPGLTLEHARIRLQYMVNPTSYLVRHIRQGIYGELPGWIGEGLIALTLVSSMGVMSLYVMGLFLGPWNRTKVLLVLMVAGTLAGCALVAALTRYRVPIVPLMAPFVAVALMRWRELPRLARRPSFWLLGAPVLAFLVYVWVQYLPYNYA